MNGKGAPPRIVIATGDPNGIGPEIAIKALADPGAAACARLALVGSAQILEQAARSLGDQRPIQKMSDTEAFDGPAPASDLNGGLPVIPVVEPAGVPLESVQPGIVQAEAGRQAYHYIEKAHTLIEQGPADALVTCPISKAALDQAGCPQVAHTEILAHLTGRPDPLTVFVAKNLWVAFFSRHLSLADAVKAVRCNPLTSFVLRLSRELERLGRSRPRLAMAALNPHSGEGGLLGKEEIEEIQPAVEALKKEGVDIEGPIPADSVFHLALEDRFDCVVSLYHDQGHIAVKTAFFHEAVSLTLGLPYLRTSVDHGTGFDIAWKGIARPESLIAAVHLAASLTG